MKRFCFMFVISGLFLFISCATENNPVFPFQQDLTFPLQEGITWEYQRTLIILPHPSTKAATDSVVSDTVRYRVTVQVMGKDTLEGVGEAFRLLELGRLLGKDSPSEYWAEAYYQLQEDGLYQVAYRRSGFALPRRPHDDARLTFLGKTFPSARELADFVEQQVPRSSILDDSLIIEQSPARVLPNPLAVGKTWLFRDVPGLFRIDKTIDGLANLETPLGKIQAYSVRYLYTSYIGPDLTANIDFRDFVSEIGLVRRILQIKNIAATTQEGETTNSFDMRDEIVLLHWGKYVED